MLSCLALGADLHSARDSEVTKVSEVSEVRGLVKMLTDSFVRPSSLSTTQSISFWSLSSRSQDFGAGFAVTDALQTY